MSRSKRDIKAEGLREAATDPRLDHRIYVATRVWLLNRANEIERAEGDGDE